MENYKEFFKEIIAILDLIESQKITLSKSKDCINYNKVFMLMDKDNDNEINANDLFKYSTDNRLAYDEKLCEFFISKFDPDFKGSLSFDNFLNLVLPLNDGFVRKKILNDILILNTDIDDGLIEEDKLRDFNFLLMYHFNVVTKISEAGLNPNEMYNTIISFSNNKNKNIDENLFISYFTSQIFNIPKEDDIIKPIEIKNFFVFLDFNKDNSISLSDLQEVFAPLTVITLPTYAVNELEDVSKKIQKFFAHVGEVENAMEQRRIQICSNEEISLNKIFNLFNTDNKQYINNFDIFKSLRNGNFIAEFQSINYLFVNYYNHISGQFNFEEFVSLFTPLNAAVNKLISFKSTFLNLRNDTIKSVYKFVYDLVKNEKYIENLKNEIFKWDELDNTQLNQEINKIFNVVKCKDSIILKEDFRNLLNNNKFFELIWFRLQFRKFSDVSCKQFFTQINNNTNNNISNLEILNKIGFV